MPSLNDLIRDLRLGDILTALVAAYKSGNTDYLLSAANLIHDEFTYVVSEGEEFSEDRLKRVSILHALYCVDLGLMYALKGVSFMVDVATSLNDALANNDVSGLTLSLTAAVMAMLRGDYSWVNGVMDVLNTATNAQPLLREIVKSFLELMNILKPLVSS
ncbi:MAG: hypothetical protein L7H10_06380 [Vulcanisaeta sp.]|jgi:hypothetical protein|nr:hypothetical protein [Vulcanisaeta sp.]MCG2887624.1 hypothetical protein [Vulcanisaeta sp.]